MRIGIFGGSFDPIHLGHLVLAEQCREQGKLERILFIPAARPPHKLERTLTAFHHRQEMIELAISGSPEFEICTLEKDRPGPSFTVDTLQELRTLRPEDELHLILGADSVADLPNWYQPAAIAELAELLIVRRPGVPPVTPPPGFRAQNVEMPLLEISSSDIRTRIQAGRSVRYLVPRAVECYVQLHHLYPAAPAS